MSRREQLSHVQTLPELETVSRRRTASRSASALVGKWVYKYEGSGVRVRVPDMLSFQCATTKDNGMYRFVR